MAVDIPNWYWTVAGDETKAYSSAAVAYVPASDATFQAWLAAGNLASRIKSEQELWDVLAKNGQTLPAGKTTSDAAKTDLVTNQVSLVLGEILFNHENRIRALEGNTAVTKQQFINAVKNMLT